jgi:light-regulated signal transduction histidine kinase (bacteriophytochrome)
VVQEGHGGSVTVDSVVGQGTTFSVRIPVSGLPRADAVDPLPDASAA